MAAAEPPHASTSVAPPTTAAAASLSPSPTFPIEFLLASGNRHRWSFGGSASGAKEETVGDTKERIWKEWPQAWEKTDPRPPSAEYLGLLYLGRFLDDSKTLASYNLRPSTPTDDTAPPRPSIVHLHIRTLSPPDEPLKGGKKSSACGGCVVS